MTCEDCPWFDQCSERRGVCVEFMAYLEKVKKAKHEIEELNKNFTRKAAGATAEANKVIED